MEMAEARTNEETDNRVNEETDNRVNEETDKRGNEEAPKAEGTDVKAEEGGKKKLNRDTAENRKKGDKKEASKMLPFYTKASSGLRMGHMYLNNPLPIAKIAHWKEMCKKKKENNKA